MAKRTVILVHDDLDHSTDGVTTHRFALDNVTWDDLSAPNLARLTNALAPFIAVASRFSVKQRVRRARQPLPRATRGAAMPARSAAI